MKMENIDVGTKFQAYDSHLLTTCAYKPFLLRYLCLDPSLNKQRWSYKKKNASASKNVLN